MSGSSARRRSIASASWGAPCERPGLEDRPGTVADRARVAGGVDRKSAAWAQWAPRRQDRLGLLGERDHLLMAEPEADTGRVLRRAVLAGCRLAGHQDEHPPLFVIAQAHLANLPFRLAGREGSLARRPLRHLDPLRLHHLMEAHDQCLDLDLLAAQGERSAPAFGQQKELPLARLADRRHAYLVNRVELEDWHWVNTKSRGALREACKLERGGWF